MKSSVRLITALMSASLMITTVGCGVTKGNTTTTAKDEKKPVTISYFTTQARLKDAMKQMAEKLKTDENITVDFQAVPDPQFVNLLQTKIATGDMPDIIDVNVPEVYPLYDATKNFIDLSNEPWVSRIVNSNILKAKDGKIYAMPKESSEGFVAAYYNKKVFKDLGLVEPKTYNEFLTLLETIKTKGNGITPLYMSDKDLWTTQIPMVHFIALGLQPNDKAMYEKLATNKVKWAEVPEIKQALSDFESLYTKGYTNKDHVTATYDMAKESVATGKAAMMINGEWAASDMKAKWPDVDLGAFVIPYKDKDIITTNGLVSGIMASKAGKHIEDTKRFLNLWSQPKYQDMFFASNPGFPGFKDINGGKVLPCVQNLVDNYVKKGKFVFQINDSMTEAGTILSDLWSLYVEVSIGSKTPDQALQAWDKKFADFMKTKQMPGF